MAPTQLFSSGTKAFRPQDKTVSHPRSAELCKVLPGPASYYVTLGMRQRLLARCR